MSKNNITRKIARVETCKFSHKDVQRLNNRPDMDCCESSNWLFDFGNWIETAYDGKISTYEEMAAEFNANRSRKFKKRDGKIVNYCRVINEYLRFMCLVYIPSQQTHLHGNLDAARRPNKHTFPLK